MSESEKEAKYQALKQKLEESSSWPAIYMFKFIVKADKQKIAQVENLFNTKEAQVTMRESKKGTFVSITAKEMMLNPDEIINRYKEAEGIEGLISL